MTTPEAVPRQIAEFEIVRRLGVGGMAEVFLAKKRGAEGTYKLLVLKRVLPAHGSSRRFRTMFAEEAQLATRLNHPNIVQVYEFQDYGDEGQLLSMEYVEGPDLRKLAKAAAARSTRLPPWVVAYIAGEVAKGLHYAHERKDEGGAPLDIVHRDVSPQNVLLSYDGAVKIADFGIATANLFREEPGVLKGKTAYMSPEQAAGDRVDRRTDVFSLGVVVHELLTGRPMHAGLDGQELLEAVRACHIEPPSTYAREVPPTLEAIVMKALARDPAARFQSARELAHAVTHALFQHQQLVDAHVLEGVVGGLVSREHTSPGVAGPPEASVAMSSGAGSDSDAERDPSEAEAADTGPGHRRRALDRQSGREVRHVAVADIHLQGLDELEREIGVLPCSAFLDRLRTTLDEIAYKRGARLVWHERAPGGGAAVAHAIVGLLANPSRAAVDAAWLAIDVHEAVQGFSGDMPVELGCCIGIVRGIASGLRDAAGHLVDHELAEPATHLAEVLGTHAPRGATWVAGGLYRLVRREFVWEDAPTISLDGPSDASLPRDMRVYGLVRPLTRDERANEAALAPTDLVGRDAEVAELHAAFHAATSAAPGGGAGRVVTRVVFGELGIGKTALVNAFLADVRPDARVLRLESSPARSELPFAAVADWVRELTGIRADQPLAEARAAVLESLGSLAAGRHGAELAQRLAELATGTVTAAADEADAAHHKRLVAAGVRRFIAKAALEAPLIVIVDGVQWVDRPSLELIVKLATRQDPVPVLVVLVSRPDDRAAPFLEGLVRIELKRLSAEHQVRLLETRLGVGAGVAAACQDVLPRAGGNPFFLLEMVDSLLERGDLAIRERPDGTQELVRTETAGDAGLVLPSTLEQLLADRMVDLPAAEQQLVEWLAVAGGPLEESVLAELVGGDIDEPLTRACARGVCDRRGEEVDVRHPLLRDVAYGALDGPTKVRMHRALGQRLASTPMSRGLNAALVATHLTRGNEREAAADLYLEAASAARASYQMPLATRYYRRAITLLPQDDLRALEAHEALEALCRILGRGPARRRHLETLRRLARKSGQPYWVAMALVRSARYELDMGHLSKGLTTVERAERAAAQGGVPELEVQAQSMAAEMLRDLGDMQGALSACDRALETATRANVPSRVKADVLRTRGTLLRRVGRVEEAIEAHVEAIAMFRASGVRRLEARAKNALAFAMFVLGRYEDAIALALDAIRIDVAIGGRFQMAKTLSNIGQSYSRLGDFPRGLAYLRRARDAHERYGDQDSRADTLLGTAEVLLELGDLAPAEALVGDASALTQVTGSAYDSVHEKILRALLYRASGDAGAAVMHAFDARQSAEAQAYVAFHFYAMAVEAAARVDIGENHTGILLATTALGAIDTIQGSEYGLETRALACEAVTRAQSPQARAMAERTAGYAGRLERSIRSPELRALFRERPLVARVLGAAIPAPRSLAPERARQPELEREIDDLLEPTEGEEPQASSDPAPTGNPAPS